MSDDDKLLRAAFPSNIAPRRPRVDMYTADDFVHLTEQDQLLAARFWATNACIMSSADPWKSHFAIIPVIACLAPEIRVLCAWLVNAANSVGDTDGNLYASCLNELAQNPPPWRAGQQFAKAHNEKWCKDLRVAQMQELLGEIRKDAVELLPGMFKDTGRRS